MSSPKLDVSTLAYVADMLERQGFPRASAMLWNLTKPLQAQAARDAEAAQVLAASAKAVVGAK